MEFLFLGWCKEGNHDKVWGVSFVRGVPFVTGEFVFFWGRRDKKLQYKVKEMDYSEVFQLIGTKRRKGYKEFDPEDAAEISARLPKELFKLALRARV